MEIIREGEDPYTKKCPECGCVFSYNKGDIKKKRDWAGALGFWSNVYVVCPHCGKKIKIGYV